MRESRFFAVRHAAMMLCVLLPLLSVPLRGEGQFIKYNITTNKSYAVIPFEMHNDFIVVPVKMNGFPLRFILDTGSAHTIIIYKEYTDLAGVGYQRSLFIRGADRSQLIKVLLTEGVSIELEEVEGTDQHLLVLENTHIQFDRYAGTGVDGILGLDIFKRFVVKIDYETQRIYLFEPDKGSHNTSKYDQMTFHERQGKMVIKEKAAVSPGDSLDVHWMLDSGAALTVMFQLPASDTTLLPQLAVPGNIGRGLGGYILGYMGKVDRVDFGGHTFQQLIGNFQQIADSLYQQEVEGIPEGILGNKILQQFHLIFDYRNQTIYLRPNRLYKKDGRKDLSGMGITASGPHLNRFTIEEIYPDSPAERAGLQAGDVIHRIGRRQSLLMTLEGINRRLSAEAGKRYRIVVKRDGERVKTELVLGQYL